MMKAHANFIRYAKNLTWLIVIALNLVVTATVGQYYKSASDLLPWYKGWKGDPSTITVSIGQGFTEDEQDEIRTAMERWNDAGCHPTLVETTTPPGNICIVNNDNLGSAGLNTPFTDALTNETLHDMIQIDTDSPILSVAEIATHELGHALGLDDTENEDDAMRSDSTNGVNGVLSENDIAEIQQASYVSATSIPKDKAEYPLSAIMPGSSLTVSFDLSGYYPPEVILALIVQASPFYDQWLVVDNTVIGPEFLEVGITVDNLHPNSTMYLLINLIPPQPYDPVTFLGIHYINSDPVPPVTFECPFEVHEENGTVYVNWTELCTYPYGNELSSELVVDDTITYLNKGGGNYAIQIEPGNHSFELFVDDYQVNNAYAAQTFFVTGYTDPQINQSHLVIYPNPFHEKCNINLPCETGIRIYDSRGNLVEQLNGLGKEWIPAAGVAPGVYIIHAESDGLKLARKIVYYKN